MSKEHFQSSITCINHACLVVLQRLPKLVCDQHFQLKRPFNSHSATRLVFLLSMAHIPQYLSEDIVQYSYWVNGCWVEEHRHTAMLLWDIVSRSLATERKQSPVYCPVLYAVYWISTGRLLNIFRAPRHQNCTPLLQQLHWLPISERIKYKTACMCYNAITGFHSLLSFWAATPLQSFPLSPLFVRHTHAQNPTLQPQNPWLSHFLTLWSPHLEQSSSRHQALCYSLFVQKPTQDISFSPEYFS